MIAVQIARNGAGEITGFAITGHANAAPHGQDIICAGVAALSQTAVLGLERHLARKIKVEQAAGRLVLELSDPPDASTAAILETMLLGLREIARLSPQRVRIAEHRR